MTENEAIEMLQKCIKNNDTEEAHSDADNILCKFLIELGYQRVVDEWEKVNKWYS